MTQGKEKGTHLGILAVIVVALATGLGLLLLGTGDAGPSRPPAARPDVIAIRTLAAFGKLERPPALFPHDLHVQSLQEAGQQHVCRLCHLAAAGDSLSFKFMRLSDEAGLLIKAIYHEDCVACHRQRAADRAPGAEACAACHQREPAAVSSRVPMAMDSSLHMRHVAANDHKCEVCHHRYDAGRHALVTVKGQESSCRDCHHVRTEGDTLSFQAAAHLQCVNCHRRRLVSGPTSTPAGGAPGQGISGPVSVSGTGPTDCAGCHDAERQRAIPRLDPVPRLERHQPDMVLIHAAQPDLPRSKMPTVPFNHLIHEQYNSNCRVCHHEGMKACRDCHTFAGRGEGNGITLAIAMHAPSVDHSCVGCHETRKRQVECLGCHELMPSKGMDETSCRGCHDGPQPADVATAGAGGWPVPALTSPPVMEPSALAARDLPDSVTIDDLARKYEPAVLPHGRIVQKLRQAIAGSALARHFHGSEDVMCRGCHHHSPVGMRPPSCANCHAEPFQPANLMSPGLYGAYHQLCIGCHQQMGLPAGCSACHTERQTSSGDVLAAEKQSGPKAMR